MSREDKNKSFPPVNPAGRFYIRLLKRYWSDNVGPTAAALAYYFLFSFFPFLVFVSMLLGYLNLPLESVTRELRGILPGDVIDIIRLYVEYVTRERSESLLVFGLVFTLYFPSRAVDYLMVSVNRAYRVAERRSFLAHQAVVLLYTLFLVAVIFISLALLTVGPVVLSYLARIFHFPGGFVRGWNYIRFLILGCLLFAALAVLYHTAPKRKMPLGAVLPGVCVSLVSWLAISAGYALYVERIALYSAVYGSVGTVIVLLIWLYFSALTLIMGAEFNHVLLTSRSPSMD
ncbi:YihY/virulence factor BrkB family protein [Papillibacter cinnamivorans]|uniref:Membrane protein n=1 Tax=Papillibacter cinnamivorans DSM 12816 TaxID=1122930 RepID=A0A1W1YYS6_9FIRM|nr:YihY/virulence factor BrkB family protein [Papillibacter cinnamivorans]SMC41365.1 membrane protein [Papillibacter cinnamivorans DSM 12816]